MKGQIFSSRRCFLRSVALVAAFCCTAIAQNASTQQKEQAPNGQVATFQSGVNLVLVPVIVRDKKGQPIGGLTKDDFQLFDKGKRQVIASFSIQSRSANASPSVAASDAIKSTTSNAVNAAGDQPNPANPQQVVPADKPQQRFVVYLIDDLNTTFADFAAVREAMDRHIRGLAINDQAAIYTFSGHPDLDFTNDRDKVEATIAKLRMSMSDVTADHAKECPEINYYLADLIINKGDERVFAAAAGHTALCEHVPEPLAELIVKQEATRQLAFVPQQTSMALRTLRLAIKQLAEKPGERLIVLTSPGFFETSANKSDMQQVLKLATQANITISGLNTRGLYSNQPDPSFEKPEKAWRQVRLEGWQAQEGILQDLAQGTGGTFIHNNDGFHQALDRLATPPEFSYVLGFSPDNPKADGSFHAIKIRLVGEKGVSIEARRGYYALQEDPGKESARLEVDDALFSRDQRNEIPVVLQTGYIEPNKGDPTVTVVVKVDLKSLRFRIANQRNLDTLTVVSALFNAEGSYVTGTTKTVNLQLRNETLTQPDPAVTLRLNFPVKRGAYVIRLVIRDAQSGAMTTFTRPEKIT